MLLEDDLLRDDDQAGERVRGYLMRGARGGGGDIDIDCRDSTLEKELLPYYSLRSSSEVMDGMHVNVT